MASPYEEYRTIIGNSEHDLLKRIADPLRGLKVVMINSTRDGGGVAEILRNMLPLLNELGIYARWDIVEGDTRFYSMTKTLHNALHGKNEPLNDDMIRHYWEVTESNAKRFTHLSDKDIVFVHDPQPAGLIRYRKEKDQSWIFRCHVDVSSPLAQAWDFVGDIVKDYSASVFSHPSFAQKLEHPQFLISPSIDPLCDKNKEIMEDFIEKTVIRFGIDPSRPIITQVSRFDKLKDPLGVIEAYKIVKKKRKEIQLLLAGGAASDDPESVHILPALLEEASHDQDIHILDLPPFSDLEINALQRGSTMILQKSLREGFALTVTEALWKEKPVIASAVGGIPDQILHGKTGWLVRTIEGTAQYIKRVLDNPEENRELGRQGKEHVRRNFLVTRHIREYMSMFLCVLHPDQNIIRLH
jgi:trehalose synthase